MNMRGAGISVIHRAFNWLRMVPYRRGCIFLLLGVDILGTAYGFYWYRHQLRETNPLYWPVVPDSPAATLFFALFLAIVLRQQAWRGGQEGGKQLGNGFGGLIQGLAYLSNLKYGLWTPAIMAHYWVVTGSPDFESIHLTLSHLGMALQSFLFARAYPAPAWALFVAGAWLLFNDVVDYVFGFHPYLPVLGSEGVAAFAAFSLTLLSFGFHMSFYHWHVT